MFGSGVPVCAVQFSCIGELVHHGVNGMTFTDSAQLAQQLITLLFQSEQPLTGSQEREIQEIPKQESEKISETSEVLKDPMDRHLLSCLKRNASSLQGWSENWEQTMPGFLSNIWKSNK